MCTECLVEKKTIIEDVIPGFNLAQATKDYEAWFKGLFALTDGQEPYLIFLKSPVVDPLEGLTDEEIDESPDRIDEEFWHVVRLAEDVYQEVIKGSIMMSWQLVQACIAAGYNPEEDGARVMAWLVDHIARKLQ